MTQFVDMSEDTFKRVLQWKNEEGEGRRKTKKIKERSEKEFTKKKKQWCILVEDHTLF